MRPGNGKKVVVAMSGGVDSSVAAALLKQQGYQVVGCFMRLGSEDSVEPPDIDDFPDVNHHAGERSSYADGHGHVTASPAGQACATGKPGKQGCCSLNDAADARLVAALLDVPFYVVNFKKDFGRIIDYFVGEYNAGRTPNPCVRCNDWLKFGKLHHYAQSIDADYVATGHYAQIIHTADRTQLHRGRDHHKDQSYVLFGAPYEQLQHMLLPIGGYEKDQVRQIAEEWNLPVFDKPDSQEICFVPDNDYAGLVRRHAPDQVRQGDILDTDGNVVGQHDGHQHFTIGQRRGVGVAMGYPIYVVDRNPHNNTITIGSRDHLLAEGCTARETNWLIAPPADWLPCLAKVRYNSQPEPARVRATGEDQLEVRFNQPIQAVTPGQAVVCYDDDIVIGGGWIDHVQPA